MTVAKTCVISSFILAGMSVLLQTISFIIPGWFIVETDSFTLNMAMWYVIYCGQNENITEMDLLCDTFTYKRVLSIYRDDITSVLGDSFRSMIGNQVQVTSCLLLATGALLLILFQLKTFQQQRAGQPTIYDTEPRGTCNLRSKFIYSGGFAAIFQLFSGVLLGLVIVEFAKRYFSYKEPRPPVPYTLFIAGLGVASSGLCGFIELIIAFRTKENRPNHGGNGNKQHLTPQQLLPLNHDQGQGHNNAQGQSCDRDLGHRDSPVRNTSIDDGDYYGQDYNVENPAFCTQGARKSCQSNKLFPGYRLGRNNLQGHNKKWWRKVAFASAPYL